MTNSHCAGTTKMWYNEVTRKSDWRDKSSDDFGIQSETVRTWHDVKDCSKHELRWLETTDRRRSTGVCVGQSVTEARRSVDVSGHQDRWHGGVHRRGTTVLFPADNTVYTRTASLKPTRFPFPLHTIPLPPFSFGALNQCSCWRSGVCERTSTRKTQVARPRSSFCELILVYQRMIAHLHRSPLQ